MSFSVNTNPGALTALRNLESANRRAADVGQRVSTGQKVRGAVDDASNFAIAQGLRGDVRALGAIVQGLNNAKGIVRVALAGATAVSDLLGDIRKKITEAANEGNTEQQQAILQEDYVELVAQFRQILENAEYNGLNILIEIAVPFNTAVGQVRDVDVLANLQGDTIRLNGQRLDLSYALLEQESIATPAAAVATLAVWEEQQEYVNTALGQLGSDLRRLELQTEQIQATLDAIEEGLGNIVDADLARAAADLSAAQVRQELSTQTLGIANQAPTVLLGLFQ